MSQDLDPIDALRRAGAARSGASATRIGIAAVIAVAALAASPQAPGAAASAEHAGAGLERRLSPPVTPAPQADALLPRPSGPAATPQPIVVQDPRVIVNRDGSATISAELTNDSRTEVALMDVLVQRDGEPVPVSATPMWLPVLPDYPSRVGDASDAGGFVIPAGVAVGSTLTLRFVFDSGVCLTEEVDVVARSAQHSAVYPKNGTPLGPATTTQAVPDACR